MLRNLRSCPKRVIIEDNDQDLVSSTVSMSKFLHNREAGLRQTNVKPRVIKCECKPNKRTDSSVMQQMFPWLAAYPDQSILGRMLDTKPDKLVQEWCEDCTDSFPRKKQKRKKTISEYVLQKLPGVLSEREFEISQYDKIFASAWLNNHQVLVGTKCQKLIVIDTITGGKTLIPSILDSIELSCNSQAISSAATSSGIHSIAINPSATLVAIGAGKPNEVIQVYRLPSLEPFCLLKGHSDMVFSVQWIDDTTLVSGSRDKTLKQWKIHPDYISSHFGAVIRIPVYEYCSDGQEHQEKVRDVVINQNLNQTFTLSADGFVKIWDATLNKVNSAVPLSHSNETVCLSLDKVDNLVSVGSQAHISIIDPRIGRVVHSFESLDEGWGVRSMCIYNNLLTIGGGYGRISFYDLRKANYITWENQNSEYPYQSYLKTGKGWLNKDTVYSRHFQGVNIKNAVYTLSFDPFNSKLFAAGGPLQLNLKGSYCSIWE